MNDDFSFDGAAAADMPLDLSSSSMSLPEGGAATGFHLPDMEPAQEQANVDSPKLADEWKQDVQMLDDGGLNGLEESAGLEAVVSLDAEAAEEEGSESFNPQLGDTDSVRRQGAMLMRGVEERRRELVRDRQNMVMNLLRAGRNDQDALKRMAERWGEDSVFRLQAAGEEDRSYMLGMRLAEVLGDGDSDAGFQIYKNTHDLWGKGIVSPEQVWKDFSERGKEIVEREDRLRVERESKISDLNGVVGRYVSGEQDSLSADERLALFNAGVSVASMEKARRGVRLIESFEKDSKLYNDDIADDLFSIIGNDTDSLMMLCNLLRNRSRSTANDRLGMGGAEKRADEAYQEVMENSNPLVMAVAGQAILNAKMTAGGIMTGKVAGVKTKRSLERALQNMRSKKDDRMKAVASRVALAKARQMGLSDAEAFELAGVQEQERRELQQKRSRIFSALTTALEGGEDDYFSSDEASSLSKVGYHLGSMTGDTAPWFLPYAGPLIGLNTSMQRRREEGYMLGLDVDEIEKRSFWFGAADTAEEMIGFHALFKATPLYKGVRKLLRTEKGSGVRALVSGSPAAQYALQGVAGTVEEGILEPTAGYLMRSAINPLLDDERGKQTLDQYTSELSQTVSGEQGLALLAFSFGLSGLNYSQLSRAAKEFRLSLKNYEALGGTAQGYLEAREEKTAEGFLNKALSNLHDSWMENPQGAMERASVATGERLSGERIESLRELDAWRAAETAGMVPRVEPAEQDGMFRVYPPSAEKVRPEAQQEDTAATGQQTESNQPSYTLMDGEQMTAYLQAFVSEQVENDILYTQNMLAGDVTVNQALAQRRVDAAELITRTETDEQTGAERVVIAPETLGQMKARADMAMAAIRALETEGVSYEDAAVRMDASLSEHIPLGTLVQTWDEAQERIRTEQARNPEFKAPAMDAPFSRAYVTNVRRGDTFRRVLRYARGSATVEDLMEETMEQAVISWQAEQNTTWGEFGTMLQDAQKSINDLFPEARGKDMQFIHLDAGKPVTGHDAIEAFSKIGRSRWLTDALNNTSLPSWIRKLLNHLVKFLGAFKARVELGEMVRQAEEQGVFTLPVRQALAVMLDAGNALYRDQQGDLIALTMERAKAQADLDAALGRGVATEQEAVEEQLAERNAADELGPVDRAQEEADDANAQQARRERTEAEVEMLGEQDDDGVFNGGVSIRIVDGVRQGFIDKDRLTLCPDVPQFKQGADEKTGVVNRIVGAWQRNAAPISVWRRTDGSLQVISGRHRLDACTDADINCTVYDEGDRFNLDWARRRDVENNIRDGQASAFEIARYVRDSSLSMAEAVERGIARKGASLKGVELGLYASQELLDALGNGLVSPDDAYRVALAFRNDAEVQRSGLAVLLDGGSFNEAYSVMTVRANMERIRAVAEAGGMTFETDLFGNSNADAYLRKLAEYATRKQRELSSELSAISGAARKPEVARKYGVNVKDKAALDALIKEMREKARRWKNFGIHEDLLREANDAVMVEMGLKRREDVDRENGVLPLGEQDGSGDSATGELMFAHDVSRMLDAARKMGTTPAEGGTPVTNFSIVSIPSGDVVRTVLEMREQLKPLQGRVFTNKNTGIQAVIEARVSAKTKGKAGASQMSVANLKRFGTSVEDARTIHYTAATRIHELFENAEDALFEKSYKDDPSRAGAYHLFNRVEVEGFGSFDVNVTAIAPENKERINTLYTIELTIENPSSTSEEVPLSHGGVSSDTSGVSTRNLSSYRSFVEKEKASIKKKAVADGTLMKAPNGADTNLTEDQWLSVRTEAFKRWFGDWENDPENASKVVDENGEPLAVYHGSDADFTVFDPSKSRANMDIRGMFFSPWDIDAGGYGGKVRAFFLNLRNPADEGRGYSALNRYAGQNEAGVKARDLLRRDGFDGVNNSDEEYIAFEPTQIKSATDNRGTYDPRNPDTTFSIIGEKAESYMDYHNNGLSYTDPADGKRKAIIDSRGVQLKKERMGLSEGGHVNVSLAAALDFPELFRAYPKLRKLRVDFYRDSKSTTGGFTDQRENYIAVNVARGGKLAGPGLMLDTILHEVQHVIQLHEGFALGSNGSMGKDSALAYLDASIAGLHGRDDAWARAARPRLKSMRADVASGVLDPAMIYFLSHGEQEARLAGRFSENGTGVVMSGLNGFRLLDKPAFSIPLTGNITELGGITFGAGRFGRLADRVLSPNGDWLYDEMVFKMRAATQRAVTKLDLYHAGNREAGLEMIAECQELISTVERYLPNTYGFGLEPYKIWLNVFSLLYGGARRGSEVQDIVSDALAAIPMSKWPEIMEGSFIKSFVKWARNRPELEAVIEEAQTEIAERQSDYELDSSPGADNKAARSARKGIEQEVWHKLFLEYGAEFLEEYGEKKVHRLIGKFMRRVVEQIDRYRKDRTLGRIRRVVASVAPKRTPKGKPLRGKIDVAAYEKLDGYMRLLEMTGAQHEEFFRKKYPVKKDQETGEEVDPWDQVKADDMVSIVLPDDKGQPSEVTVPKLAFETYACYEKMNVERAECCARALGELISTSRDAWENARVKKQQELEAMLKPVFEAAGRTDASARGAFRTLDKLKNPVKWTLGLLDGFMNGYQYFDSLARVKPFAPIARHFADRLAVAEANVASGEKEMMLARANAAAEASGLTDEYDLSDWVLERRKKRDTGIVITEQEPDWAAQARQKYRDGLVGLVRRKVRKHGADKVMAQAAALIRMDERMKSELDLFWPASGGWEFDRERDAVVFTEGELKRYGNQQEYVREHAEQERGRSKYARDGYVPRSMPLDALSRMEAAYLILLHEQADYTDAMRLLGFTPEVMDQLRDFAGEDVITFSYALRDALNKRSQDVKNAMERKTGTPFPLVDHYFRAFFDVGFQSVEKTILDAASYGEAAGGGKFGMTYARKKNRLRLDLNMDVCTAFDAAMREQTLFLHMSEVSNDLRRLLSYRGEEGDTAAGLEKLLGRDALSKLKAWSDAMDRAGAETVIGHLHANRLINAVSSAAARTLLPGRVGTWIKQWTGILNTLHSSDALDASDWLGSMKRAATGRLVMTVKEMKKQPELSSRYKGMSALNEAMNADGAGRHVSRLGKANRKAMEDIERRDMQSNAISCAVLYDAMYRKVQREEPDAGKEKWHEAAMMEVRRSLSSKGQPMVLTQRSLNAQTRQWMTVGMFFLGGESINTFAKCLDLFRRGDMKHVGRGMAVWVAHGLLVALMDGLLHWFTDDEKKRKRRSAWDLLYYTIAGPLAGIPIVSGLLGDGLESLGRAAGLNVWNPKDSSLIPLSNWSDVARAGKRVARVFDGKPHDWTDYPLAFADALRIAAAGSIAFNARSSRAGAAVEGAALTTAAFVNLMEFVMKMVRRMSK